MIMMMVMRVNECLSSMAETNVIVIIIVTILTLILVRLMYVLHHCGKPLRSTTVKSQSTLVVLGSGGHTAEMINLLLVQQKDRFMPRYYIAAATDNMSLQKA
ncbi:UDP-N-acetylglucosamine transferase subunit alg14 [Bienertia sinuspersici]